MLYIELNNLIKTNLFFKTLYFHPSSCPFSRTYLSSSIHFYFLNFLLSFLSFFFFLSSLFYLYFFFASFIPSCITSYFYPSSVEFLINMNIWEYLFNVCLSSVLNLEYIIIIFVFNVFLIIDFSQKEWSFSACKYW